MVASSSGKRVSTSGRESETGSALKREAQSAAFAIASSGDTMMVELQWRARRRRWWLAARDEDGMKQLWWSSSRNSDGCGKASAWWGKDLVMA